MALDRDELNKRRRAREEQRRKRQEAQRRLYIRLAAAALILLICGVGIFMISRENSDENGKEVMSTDVEMEETLPAATEAPTEAPASWEKEPEVIHVAAAGDLNVTDKVVWSGQQSGSYDYTKAFMDVAPILSEADLTVLNFEGNVCGAPYGTGTTSAPVEMIEALKNAGVDLLQVANSCSINNGLIGLTSTLSGIRSAGIEPVGAFSTPEEFKRAKGYTICNVGDVKIAVVAFTKGMGGLAMPVGSENCVNLLYTDYESEYKTINTDGIKSILKSVRNENPDITIALLHWGSELNDEISSTQEKIVTLLQKEGVDAIIGSHPHLVQEIKYDETTGQLVAYSLGDFFGDGSRSGTNYSIILDMEITKDYDTGETKITGYKYTPIYTLSEDQCDGDRRVVRIENAMSAYDLNFIDKITKECYDDMQYSLTRISDRVNGKDKKTDAS